MIFVQQNIKWAQIKVLKIVAKNVTTTRSTLDATGTLAITAKK